MKGNVLYHSPLWLAAERGFAASLSEVSISRRAHCLAKLAHNAVSGQIPGGDKTVNLFARYR
jgi:hypothetical protein